MQRICLVRKLEGFGDFKSVVLYKKFAHTVHDIKMREVLIVHAEKGMRETHLLHA